MKELIIKIDDCKSLPVETVEAEAAPFNEAEARYLDIRVRVVVKLDE